MTAIGSSDGPLWIVGESDFGGPMIEHAHASGMAVAYVLFGRNGGEFAQCTECGERLRMDTAHRAGHRAAGGDATGRPD